MKITDQMRIDFISLNRLFISPIKHDPEQYNRISRWRIHDKDLNKVNFDGETLRMAIDKAIRFNRTNGEN